MNLLPKQSPVGLAIYYRVHFFTFDHIQKAIHIPTALNHTNRSVTAWLLGTGQGRKLYITHAPVTHISAQGQGRYNHWSLQKKKLKIMTTLDMTHIIFCSLSAAS